MHKSDFAGLLKVYIIVARKATIFLRALIFSPLIPSREMSTSFIASWDQIP
jgi:hypothetical protein